MNKIKKIAISTKNHVSAHKVAYAIAGTTIALYYAVQKPAVAGWTEFMVEKGIDPMEFFNPEYYAEKIA